MLCILCLNNIYHVNVYTNQVFLNRECEIVQKLFILKLEPNLDLEPEKLSEHGGQGTYQQS